MRILRKRTIIGLRRAEAFVSAYIFEKEGIFVTYMVYEHTPGAERETTIDFDAQTASVDIAPGQWATVPFLEPAQIRNGAFAFRIEQGGLIRCYEGTIDPSGNVEGKMVFQGGMEGVVVEFSTASRPVEAPPMPAGGPPPGGPGMPPPGGPGGPPPRG